MKDAYITEVLLLTLAGISGIFIFIGKWYFLLLGFLLLVLDSYVLTSKLKEQTIKEYIKLTSDSNANTRSKK